MRYLPRRCWRARLIRRIPSALLDFPFAVTIAIVATVYGPLAIHGQVGGAIQFLPAPLEIIWGALLLLGGLIIWSALMRGRTGTWLPRGLWVVGCTLLSYVALVALGLQIGDYQTRFIISSILGPIAVVQAFKMQTGHMWAVSAIRQAEGEERE